MKKIKITIQGMHCASCAANIERSLRKLDGIKEASVALMINKCSIEAEDSVKKEDIEKAVSKAGYKVTKIE